MTDRSLSRRRVLAGLAVPAAGALAGCGGVLAGSDTPTATPEPLTELESRPIYVEPALSLSAPDVAEAVDSPGEADVVVIPADGDRSLSAIVTWLAADRHVALVGEDAQPTWHEVKRSNAYVDTFGDPQAMAESCSGSTSGSGGDADGAAGSGSTGGADGSPTDCEPPDLIVASPHHDVPTTTYRATLAAEEPDDRRVFAGIDEALAD